jgi:tetratricopeptide (TPR) repeat protein
MRRSDYRFRGSASCALVAGLGLTLLGATVSQRFAGGILLAYGVIVFAVLLALPRIRLARDKDLGRWHRLDAKASRLHRENDLTGAGPLYEQALEAAEESNRPELLAVSAGHLGELYADQGQLAKAELMFLRALAIHQQREDFRAAAVTLDSLADVQMRASRPDDAVATSERWLALLRERVLNRLGVTRKSSYAGWLEHHADRLAEANRPGDADAVRARAAAVRAGLDSEAERPRA